MAKLGILRCLHVSHKARWASMRGSLGTRHVIDGGRVATLGVSRAVDHERGVAHAAPQAPPVARPVESCVTASAEVSRSDGAMLGRLSERWSNIYVVITKRRQGGMRRGLKQIREVCTSVCFVRFGAHACHKKRGFGT